MNMHVTLGRGVDAWLDDQPEHVRSAFWEAIRRVTASEADLLALTGFTREPGERFVCRYFRFDSCVAVFQWHQAQQRIKIVRCRAAR